MLDKKMLLEKAREAQKNNSYLYITHEDDNFKFYTNDRICSGDFLRKYDLVNDNLVIGLTPDSVLRYDCAVYMQRDMSIQTLIELLNNKYN